MPKGKKEPVSAQVESFGQVDIISTDPRTVVLMLDSPEGLVQAKACEALLKYMKQSENNIKELMGYDLLPRLLKLLLSQEKGLRAYAVMCIAAAVSSSETRLQVRKLQGVPGLLKLLEPEEEDVIHERTTFTVSNLAEEFSLKIELNKEGAVKPLLRLLQSPTPETQSNSAKALHLLTQHYQCRASLMEAEGLQAMLELLSSEYAIIQELGLKTIDNCMLDVKCRGVFREIGGLEKIVDFIGNKDYADLHVVALSVLSRCLEDTENMRSLQSSGCLGKLLEYIKDSTLAELKKNAAMSLSRAAKNDLNCKILHEQEVELVLLGLLTHENDGVAGAGAEGLAAMAKLMSSRQRVGQNDGVPKLVSLLSREELETRASGAKALSSVISEVPTNCVLISECNGVEALSLVLDESNANCITFAAQCVSTMSTDGSLREQCLEHEVMSKLVNKLSHVDVNVQCACTEAISGLACDSEARQMFSRSEGVKMILPLLSHGRKEVQRSACDALSLCARDTEVATAAIQQGALNTLNEMSQSSSRASTSCSTALHQLLSSNLSAKYRITGRLDSTDRIPHGFYDMGPASGLDDKFLSIKELSERPLKTNQPIFYISTTQPPPPKKTEEEGSSETSLGGSKRTRSRIDKVDKTGKETKGKKTKGSIAEQDKEDKLVEGQPSTVSLGEGLLPPDPFMWAHLQYTRTEVKSPTAATTSREQVEKLARYVCDAMGGPIENVSAFHYELPVGEVQHELRSNLVPLGEVKKGVHRHRALLFKVLCDQLAIGCSLIRGDYNRYWNETVVEGVSDSPIQRKYVVDLVTHPGRLLLDGSPEATQYTRI
jgi:HEAT repeat protein